MLILCQRLGVLLLATLAPQLSTVFAQGTAFTYQGRLNDGSRPATGIYDLRFTIYDAATNGSGVAGPITNSTTAISNGLFTVALDFGAGPFAGAARWIEIGVRTNGGGGFITLSPRQPVAPSPYALYAGSATTLESGGLRGLQVIALSPGASYSNVVDIVGGSPVNAASGYAATVTGGGATINGFPFPNIVAADMGTIGGGAYNTVFSGYGTVAGGWNNQAIGLQSCTVSGGFQNTASGDAATVSGGIENTASGKASTISGGRLNTASGVGSFIGGGGVDQTTQPGNTASGDVSVVAGGINNTAANYAAVVGGGQYNWAGYGSTVAGGVGNTASVFFATVSGGGDNTADASEATVGGGMSNIASRDGATVGGGNGNAATNYDATVPGGAQNLAGGLYSFAAGQQAQALHQGAFVWADSQNAAFVSTANDTFSVRAQGGARFVTGNAGLTVDVLSVNGQIRLNSTDGFSQSSVGNFSVDAPFIPGGRFVVLTNGNVGIGVINPSSKLQVSGTIACTTLVQTSDRNAKENFAPVDREAVLARVASLPISRWNFKQDSATLHIGPVAQDFHAAFGLNGVDDQHIATVDEEGVALAAIQGLNQKVECRSQEAEDSIRKLEAENARLKERLTVLEQIIIKQKLN